MRQSKENLRKEIEQLRRQQRSTESVISALARNDHWEEVVRRLRSGQAVEAVSDWLAGQQQHQHQQQGQQPSGPTVMPTFGRPAGIGGNFTPMAAFAGVSAHSFTPYSAGLGAGAPSTSKNLSPISTAHPQSAAPRQDMDPASPWASHSHFSPASRAQSGRSNSHPDVNLWGSAAPQTRVGRWVEDSLAHMSEGQRYSGVDQVLSADVPEPPVITWTAITTDTSFVQHLMALYFCWEYPTFASLSKEHFLRDFQNGRPRYCSPMLVNALLALGCRFSSQPSTLANPDDPYTSGDHFFKECLRLYYEEDNHHSLTTIQALGIMSIREASCGRDSESWYYAGQSIRLAVEMGLHRVTGGASNDVDEAAVQAATFWGAFSLDQ